MPTPFYHLSVAEELLAHPGLRGESRRLLVDQRPAFLLGSTAPDVQVVSGQSRRSTHFYRIPVLPTDQPAWESLLQSYRALQKADVLPPAQAAFLCGYLCHLQADWFWVLEIFEPVFGPWNTWQSFPQRLYLHNVLRAYLDRQIVAELPVEIGVAMGRVDPHHWLPFVRDESLRHWRDFLTGQLQPGAFIQTVEVFAARQGVAPQVYYRLLESESRLDAELFHYLPRSSVMDYRNRLIQENLRLVNRYLKPLDQGANG